MTVLEACLSHVTPDRGIVTSQQKAFNKMGKQVRMLQMLLRRLT